MAESTRLEKLRTNLSESISVVSDIEGTDPEALIAVNSLLNEFFMNIDGKTFIGSEREFVELNGLFAELERVAFSKTAGTNVTYSPHKLAFSTKKSGDEVTITVLEVQACIFRSGPKK